MKKKIFTAVFSISIILLMSFSCVEHEVVPPPTNNVDLNGHFEAYIDGNQVEFTQNVSGYKGYASNTAYINPSPTLSKMVYSSEMSSMSQPKSIKLSLGSLEWDAALNLEPTNSEFSDYHNMTSSSTIVFSDFAYNGFMVEYFDENGQQWVSMENSTSAQNVTFSSISQASDNLGDYSKFECSFNCYVYKNDIVGALDSIQIQSGKFNGWFIR